MSCGGELAKDGGMADTFFACSDVLNCTPVIRIAHETLGLDAPSRLVSCCIDAMSDEQQTEIRNICCWKLLHAQQGPALSDGELTC